MTLIQFPEKEQKFYKCPNCGYENWKLGFKGEYIMQVHCSECGQIYETEKTIAFE